MNGIHNASAALVQYFDSLLLDGDGDRKSEAEHSAVTLDQAVEPSAAAGSKDIPDLDLMRLRLFKVAGIPLAMPQTAIAEIVETARVDLESIASVGGTVIRQLKHGGRDYAVLELRDMILPEGHPARRPGATTGGVRVLILAGGQYGLLCDEVGGEVAVRREGVAWRTQRTSRLWLAGMVKSHNHALLDENEIMRVAKNAITD